MASVEKAYLQRINDIIHQRLLPLAMSGGVEIFGDDDLKAASRYLCVSDHSKRARPMLTLFFHQLFRDDFGDDFLSLGVAAEFIHAASLLHDDIIDEADQRRGQSSVNRAFGNAKAVLAGDFLLTEAFDLLRSFDRVLIDNAILVVRDMTRAAMMELNARGRFDVTAEILRTISVGKTGAVFAWCGYAAANYAGRKDAAPIVWDIGERIGVIFQLADDIKDFHGDEDRKDVCRDIRNCEMSLPILFACEEDEVLRKDLEHAFLHKNISIDDALKFKVRIMQTKGIDRATAMMNNELDRILSSLSPFQKSAGFVALEQFVRQLCSVNCHI